MRRKNSDFSAFAPALPLAAFTDGRPARKCIVAFRLLLQLLVLGMIWGGSFMFQRITVPALGAGVTAAGRVLLAAIALLAGPAFTARKTNFRALWKDYLLVGLGGS